MDDIDEMVKWQMTGLMMKQAQRTRKHSPQPRCHRCAGEWHGLPKEGCVGSFDTPVNLNSPTITDSK